MAQTPIRLAIFHTNDMHGRLEAMARLSGLARRLRAQATAEGCQVHFWDAGDASDRSVRWCSITKGAAFPPILNAMGYTLQTMGNDVSLPYGPQAMAAVAVRSAFAILAANCRDGDGSLPVGLMESLLIPLPGGLTLGVLGLTAPWRDMYQVFGLHLPDFCDVARDLVARLQAQGAAPIAVLSHLGLEDDRRLVEAVPGIDLVVGGHSHTRLPEGVEHSGVLIVQAGAFAEALGRVDLTLDPLSGRVLSRAAQLIDVSRDEPADPAVLEAIAAAEREGETLMARPVGILTSPLDVAYFQECGIGDLAADALCEHLAADVAMVYSGLFHRGLPAGEITLGQLDAACFTTANPCLTQVSGAQLLAALERGLDPALAAHEHHGFRGTPLGIPQLAGLVVEFEPGAGAAPRVRRVTVQGEPLDEARLYRLAHTDAESMPEIGLLQLEPGQPTRQEVPTILREVIERYLRRNSPLGAPEGGRWRPVGPRPGQ